MILDLFYKVNDNFIYELKNIFFVKQKKMDYMFEKYI